METYKRNIIIYGFGRMGLTHYAILNQLLDEVNFTFVDVDKKINYFAKVNINSLIITDDKHLKEPFDYSLICTPPMFHVPIMEKCLSRGDKHIFVEKPFGGVEDDFSNVNEGKENIRVGYVMRFNPIIQWVKNNIYVGDIYKVEGSYLSNTIEKKPKAWRNGSYSGVINEMGAHIFDLAVYLFGLESPIIYKKKVQSVISDVDDIITVEATENGVNFHFHFDWINKSYRKPVFNLKLAMHDGSEIKIDQQKVEVFKGKELLKRVSTVDLVENVPFYLRGVDFTRQMQDLIGDKIRLATVDDALVTRNLIKNILD